MQISDGKAGEIDYTLRNDAGEVLDSSEGRPPLAYLQGAGSIISRGWKLRWRAREPVTRSRCQSPPAQGYGERDDARTLTVDLSQFPDPKHAHLGAQFGIQTDQDAHMATMIAVVGERVTLDLNHPLAGETLHFDVEMVDVKEASEEEQAHGHVHDGHAHHARAHTH